MQVSWNPPFARLRFLIATAIAVVCLGLAGTALAASGGDNNAGDFWVDTVGAPQGPGHEMDPHLPCANINVWGDKMADPTEAYTIAGIPPSGTKKNAYASTWSYNAAAGGNQVMDVIDVQQLVAAAVANGDAPVNGQGFHFKVAMVQDPQKYKTFWVKCPVPAPDGGGGSPEQPGTPDGPTGSPEHQSSSPAQLVLGERITSPAKAKRAHRVRKHRRHHRKYHKVTKRALLPAFTG
jgi:hypothetical protein